MAASANPANSTGEYTALVIGSSRGIGHALVKHLLVGWRFSRVIATHRPGRISDALRALAKAHPDRLEPWNLDFSCPDSLEELAAKLAATRRLRLAIHAAGILHDGPLQPEKSLEQCRPDQLARLFEVNSIGPLMVARAVLPAVPANQPFTFAALSAMVGSIGDNRRGGWYGYRASKAALNQFMRTLAIESRRRWPQAAVVAIHPGTTDTGLSRPFQRNIQPDQLYPAETSARRILSVLDQIGPGDSGKFLNWDGSELPW